MSDDSPYLSSYIFFASSQLCFISGCSAQLGNSKLVRAWAEPSSDFDFVSEPSQPSSSFLARARASSVHSVLYLDLLMCSRVTIQIKLFPTATIVSLKELDGLAQLVAELHHQNPPICNPPLYIAMTLEAKMELQFIDFPPPKVWTNVSTLVLSALLVKVAAVY